MTPSQIGWSDLIKFNNDLARLEMKIENQSLDIKELKENIRDLKDEQQDTNLIFARGKGAVYVLMVLGVLVGSLIGFGKDILIKLWH